MEKNILSEINATKYQTERSGLCVTGELSHFDIIFREDCHLNLLFQVKDTSQIKIKFQESVLWKVDTWEELKRKQFDCWW